jgi:hypothetical protein
MIITFPIRKKVIIKIGENIKFGLSFDEFNTKIIRLSTGDFEYYGLGGEILDELAKKFNLIKKAGLNKDYFALYFQNFTNFEACMMAFQFRGDQTYMILYSTNKEKTAISPSEDFYGNNIYYIHSIWEVELSLKLP